MLSLRRKSRLENNPTPQRGKSSAKVCTQILSKIYAPKTTKNFMSNFYSKFEEKAAAQAYPQNRRLQDSDARRTHSPISHLLGPVAKNRSKPK